MLFKQSFELEKRKYKLALSQSVEDVLSRLPLSVLDMPVEEFMSRASSDPEFEQSYNLQFRIVQSSCLDVLGNISSLLNSRAELSND